MCVSVDIFNYANFVQNLKEARSKGPSVQPHLKINTPTLGEITKSCREMGSSLRENSKSKIPNLGDFFIKRPLRQIKRVLQCITVLEKSLEY